MRGPKNITLAQMIGECGRFRRGDGSASDTDSLEPQRDVRREAVYQRVKVVSVYRGYGESHLARSVLIAYEMVRAAKIEGGERREYQSS